MSTTNATTMESALSEREIDLLRSAYRVIARQGSHRISLQDVADESGVSKGLVLYHFKSKDNLLLTTMRWALLRTSARIEERVADVEPGRASISALLGAVWVGPEQNRDFQLLYLDLIEHAVRDPDFSGLFEVTRHIINGQYERVIAAGVDAGAFVADDVPAAAETMRAAIDGMFVAWLQRPDWRETHAEFCDRTERMVLGVLGAR